MKIARHFSLVMMALVPVSTAAQAGEQQPRTHIYRQIDGQKLAAHVFSPPPNQAGSETRAILLFHGGGWAAGSADWTFGAARRFADLGLVAISVQYRLSTGQITPIDALDDVCTAFAWAYRERAALGFNGRMAGYGVSAGGQLVAATATRGCPGREGERPEALPELLLLWSPALDLGADNWFHKMLQGRASAAEYSPAEHVHRGTPPTSIVHGAADTLTPLAGARRYCDRLEAEGKTCELNAYPGLGHLLTRNLANQEDDFDPDPKARADGIERHIQFLRKFGWFPAR